MRISICYGICDCSYSALHACLASTVRVCATQPVTRLGATGAIRAPRRAGPAAPKP